MKILPADRRRLHGVGFEIKTSLLRQISEGPTGIPERSMKLRIPLDNKRYVTMFSAYAPTFVEEENLKDQFYESLDSTLQSISATDKIILLGDFDTGVSTVDE